MRNKKIVKYGLTFASTAMAFVPMATFISCGSNSKDTIKLGIRAEDTNLWKPAIEAFKEATGYDVKLTFIKDQNADYALWSGNNMIPDLTIADAGVAKTGIDKQWFQEIDLNDVATNSDWLVDNTLLTGKNTKYQENADLELNNQYFSMDMMDVNKIGNNYKAMSVIWGPKLLYAWNKIGDGTHQDVFKDAAHAQNINWYVPTKAGEPVEVSNFGNDFNDSPLYSHKPDHHRLKLTVEDIREFISNAASVYDAKFNGTNWNSSINVNTLFPSTDTPVAQRKRVIATGGYGQSQRLYSIGHSILEANSGSSDFNGVTPFVNDAALGFESLVQGSPIISANANADVVEQFKNSAGPGMSDSETQGWRNGFSIDEDSASNIANEKGILTSYIGNIGYFNDEFVQTNTVLSVEDVQTAFAKHQSLFLPGAKWQYGGIVEQANNAGFEEEDITAFSLPFQTAGVDGYAVAKHTSGHKLEIAKTFLRFMMQKQVAAEIAGNKAVSTVLGAKLLQPMTTGVDTAVASSGRPTLTEANDLPSGRSGTFENIGYVYSKQTTENIFDLYNNLHLKQTWNRNNANHHQITYNQWLDRIIAMNAQYKINSNIAG